MDDDDYYLPDDDDDEEDWPPFDCHMGPDGQCGAAGSEQCEFECPIMAEWRKAPWDEHGPIETDEAKDG